MRLPFFTNRIIGLATALLLFGVALVFVEERTTFVDVAFHLFMQASKGEIAIQNFRFVSAITQVTPTWLLQQDASMATVQLAYSLVFALFYSLVWVLLEFVLRARALALGWALTWLAFATHTHFWIQSELPQGLAVFTLALALIGCEPVGFTKSVLAKAGLPILLFTAAFAHPLLVVPATFAFGLWWQLRLAPRREVWIAAAIYYLSYLLRANFFTTSYDTAAGGTPLQTLRQALGGDIPFAFSRLAQNLPSMYWAFCMVLALAFWLLWQSKQRVAALWTLAAVLGHLLLVALSYPGEAVQDFYIENLYLPAGWMAGLAIAFGWERLEWQIRPWMAGLVLVLAVLRIGQIGYVGQTIYAKRLDFLRHELETYVGRNVLVKETPELQKSLIMTWGTPYEAWVLGQRESQTVPGYAVLPNAEGYDWAIREPDRLIMTFTQPKQSELPAGRFTRASTAPYELIVK